MKLIDKPTQPRRTTMATGTAVATKTAATTRQKVTQDPPEKKHAAKLRALLENIGETYFEFDIGVAKAYDGNEWVALGYAEGKDGFEQYCKVELNYSYRSVMNRVGTGHCIMQHDIAKEDLAELGWTRFMEISSLLTDDTTKAEVKQALAKAKKMNVEEIREWKKEIRKNRVGGEVEERVTIKVQFLKDQGEYFESIIEMALDAFNLTDAPVSDGNKLGLALLSMCAEWSAGRSEGGTAAKKLQKSIKDQLKAAEETAKAEAEAKESGEETPKAPRKKRADKGKVRKASKAKAADDDDSDADPDDDDDVDGEDGTDGIDLD